MRENSKSAVLSSANEKLMAPHAKSLTVAMQSTPITNQAMTAPEKSLRRTVRVTWALTLLALSYYLVVLTNGTFDFFEPEVHGLAFNSMLGHLLQGHFTVDPSTIGSEAMVKDGKTYTYFGIFPAILRSVLLPFSHLESIHVGRASVFVAIAVSLIFHVKTWLRVLASVKATAFSREAFALVLMSLLFSSPYLFAVSNASIFHEPIVWAAAAAAVFNFVLVSAALDGQWPGTPGLYIMATAAGISLHTRANVAIGLYVALLALIVFEFYKTHQERRMQGLIEQRKRIFLWRYFGPVAVLFLFGVAYLGVNYGRWGDPFVSAYYPGYTYIIDSPDRLQVFEEFGAFDLTRVPVAIIYYLLGTGKLSLLLVDAIGTGFDWIEPPTASMLSTNPLFVLLAIFGLVRLPKAVHTDWRTNAPLGIGVAAQATTVLFLLTFMALTLRYRVDIWAFTSLAAMLGFRAFVDFADCLHKRTLRALLLSAWLALVIGMVSTHVVLLEYKFGYLSQTKPPVWVQELLEKAIGAREDIKAAVRKWPF